jgi:hypothetical protein
MAFRDLFRAGTYSTISCEYNKQIPLVHVRMQVWMDSTKTQLITELQYTLSGKVRYVEVKSIVDALPETPSHGDMYLISDNPTAELARHRGMVAAYDDRFSAEGNYVWAYMLPPEGECLYVQDRQIYLSRNDLSKNRTKADDGKPVLWIPAVAPFDKNMWDKWFDASKIGGMAPDGTPNNILRVVYEYLKTRPEFANAIDA